MSALSINGELTRGADVRQQNVMAVTALANIVKSSLGPVGLDKMLVDEVGDMTVTNDGATILKNLEVEHPAAKVLVELSNLQDQEVGDGTTSVVVLAAELLKASHELVKQGVHPTQVIAGLNHAKREACKFVAGMSQAVADLGDESILNAARTSMSSKIIGAEGDFFAKLAVDAVTAVKTTNNKGKVKYPVKAINILKAHGKSIRESQMVHGYALNCTRAAQGMPTFIKDARIALLDIDLRKMKLALGVQVLVNDPSKLADIRKREGDLVKERIELLLDAGANVVLTTQGIDDMMLKLFVERGVMAVRRCNKSDLKAIAKATGGQLLLSLADLEGNESVDAAVLGKADVVEEAKVGDGELIFIKGCSNANAASILLRGANDYMLDEVDRSLHDSLCVVKRVLESKTVVPGGGCVEAALSVHMEALAEKMSTREQLAVAAFAHALLVIPKTLAVNGAYDATELVAQLRQRHHAAQNGGADELRWTGLNLDDGSVRNNLKAGVLEPAISKVKMLRFATEAAVTLLRIDDAIRLQPNERPSGPQDDCY